MNRRDFLICTAGAVAANRLQAAGAPEAVAHTVLGPVPADQLGVVLMHEHAPTVDWSELFETPPAPTEPFRERLLATSAAQLERFHRTLPADEGPGAIIECTPIRVGRYPHLLVDLARRTKTHIIGCTGFWGEAMAPQHPWAVQMCLEKDAPRRIADLYKREILEGMEDPAGEWGERFTDVKAGIIKAATSAHMRPFERRCHQAAAIASMETGCPITTHTTDGGGLEEAELFLQVGAAPEKIIIGHQGRLDDRKQEEAHDLHLRLAEMGCYVQFDRVGHERYPIESMVRQIMKLVESRHVAQVLVGHDHVPFLCPSFALAEKPANPWEAVAADYTTVPVALRAALVAAGLTQEQLRAILIENPRRVLAF